MAQILKVADFIFSIVDTILLVLVVGKTVLVIWFSTYLVYWRPIDKILIILSIPFFLMQLLFQISLLSLIMLWDAEKFPRKITNRWQTNGMLPQLGALYLETGGILVLFTLSFILYGITLFFLKMKLQVEEQDRFLNIPSNFALLLLTFLPSLICLICL